jgi:hypothetical protein
MTNFFTLNRRYKLNFFEVLIFTTLITSVTGCATVAGSSTQIISVRTIAENNEITGASCVLSNTAGIWKVESPEKTIVKKSASALKAVCMKGGYSGEEIYESHYNGLAVGNIFIGGVFGLAGDAVSGSGYDYQQNLTVFMGKTTK